LPRGSSRQTNSWQLSAFAGPIWVPLTEDRVAGDDAAFALVSLGEEGEAAFHLLTALLDVADVVEDDGVIAVQGRELLLETQVSFGDEESLDQQRPFPMLPPAESSRPPRLRTSSFESSSGCLEGLP